MPVIVKLPSGNWRAQVRRKGKYISNTSREVIRLHILPDQNTTRGVAFNMTER